MIVVKLWGGMCNQMFQYAFGHVMALQQNDTIKFDIDFYENQPRHVGKRKLMSNGQFPALPKIETKSRNFVIKFIENKYINHIIRYNTGCAFNFGGIQVVIERLHKHYDKIPYRDGCINYYDGYWPSADYFKGYEQEIRRIFSPKSDIAIGVKNWRESINSDACVAVHIRRGDYLNAINKGKKNTIDDNSYYMRAIQKIQDILQNPLFCFFSDDLEWCRENFSHLLPNAIFVENDSNDPALFDLFAIAECDHGIMSPSTFSWWGNWLRNPDKNSIVIYPEGDYAEKFITNKDWIELSI